MKLLLKNLIFTVLVPGSVGGWIPWWLVRHTPRSPGLAIVAAAPIVAAGLVVYAWTVINFAVIGRGTPAPIDAPRKLIVRGPHRFVRNPMYLAVLAVVLGWVVAYRSLPLLAYAAAVALAFHAAVLFVEEPALRRQFGAEYAAYCESVRRWLPGRPYSSENGSVPARRGETA